MPRRRSIDSPDIQIAPMIDCVFLMLVYFMTTSSLEKSEADLSCPVGGAGIPSDPLPAVDEQVLTIDDNGRVDWNGSGFDLGNPAQTVSLAGRLAAFKATCAKAKSEASLMLVPADGTTHQAIVTLLDCVAESGIESIHFP